MITPIERKQQWPTEQAAEIKHVGVAGLAVGAALGALFQLLWPGLPFWTAVALWPLALSLGLIGAGLVSQRAYGQAQWELVIAGQFVGVVGIILLFLAVLF